MLCVYQVLTDNNLNDLVETESEAGKYLTFSARKVNFLESGHRFNMWEVLWAASSTRWIAHMFELTRQTLGVQSGN